MLTRGFSGVFIGNGTFSNDWYAWKNGSDTCPSTVLITQASSMVNLRLVPPVTSPYNYSYFSFMALGTGTTEPTFEDTFLETPIETLSFVSGSVVYSGGTKNIITYSATVRNNTEAPITVREIGIGVYHWSTGSTNNCGTMIARSVLETPVTIGVNEAYAFTYTIEI